MSIAGYQAAQGTEDPRKTEYRLFAQVTRAQMKVEESDSLNVDFREAIEWNRRMWTALEIDLASDANSLPDALKAQLISGAMWVERHSAMALRGEGEVDPLITVNRSVMEGLGANSATSDQVIEATATAA